MLVIMWLFRVVIISAVFMFLLWFIKQSMQTFISHGLMANTFVLIVILGNLQKPNLVAKT